MADMPNLVSPVATLIGRVFACDEVVAQKLIALCHPRHFTQDATILHQGDAITDAFILVLGQARAVIYSSEGAIVVAQEYSPGDVFGALDAASLIEQEADVIAVRDVESLAIEATSLAMIAQRHGEIGLALSRMLMQRLREATTRLYERTALSAQGRVFAELRRLADTTTLSIAPIPVVTDLALRVGTTRETASRAISALERRGIIERSHKTLRILAPQRLDEMIF